MKFEFELKSRQTSLVGGVQSEGMETNSYRPTATICPTKRK